MNYLIYNNEKKLKEEDTFIGALQSARELLCKHNLEYLTIKLRIEEKEYELLKTHKN